MSSERYKRHWSFVVCDSKYLFPLVSIIWLVGIILALIYQDVSQVSRIGNFIIGIGVWMGFRPVLREGINRNKNALDSSPTLPGTGKSKALNSNYFNNITFSIGDAYNQLYGFGIVILGSITGSYGDLILCMFVDFCTH